MKNVNDLKADRASKLMEQQRLVDLVRKEERELNAEEVTKFDALTAEVDALEAQIERAKVAANLERKQAETFGIVVNGKEKEEKEEMEQRFSFTSAIKNAANGGNFNKAERSIRDEAVEELRASGLNIDGNAFSIPSHMMKRGQSVTNDTGTKGGALVKTDISVVQPLEPNLVIEQLGANIMSGLVGNVSLPTSGSFTLSYVGETDEVSAIDTTFSGPTLKPKRLAGVVEISKQLLNQGSIDVENYIRARLANAVNVAVLKGALNGAGGDAPTGLYSLITTNINATAGAPTWPTIVNLESLIMSADATEQSLAYLSDPMLRGKMKSTAKDAGSGLFLAEGNALNGYRYIASSVVPTLDAGASHPLVFGDWSQMFAGFWGGMSFTVDPYTKASSSQIRIIVEIFNDIAVVNEKAFAINKVMTV